MIGPPPGRDALAARIRAFVDAALDGAPTEPFGVLLRDLHAWQRAHAPVVAALSVPVQDWTDVPAVPVDLFKEVRVGTVPVGAPSTCFRTSGTTATRRGEHHLWDTSLVDHAATRWAAACVPGAPSEVVALLHDPATSPDSSLSHMVAGFVGFTVPAGRATWHLVDGRLDLASLTERLRTRRPVFVATTAFALADWLETEPAPLPDGSILMVTGGFKGRRTELDADGLHAWAARALRPHRMVDEYGMTELSSQLWAPAGAPYLPPPWLRVVAVDPETGAPRTGGPGQLRFYDLLNLDSTVGVETLDLGEVHADGRVTLHGRLPGAEARGCSLSVEDAWGRDER